MTIQPGFQSEAVLDSIGILRANSKIRATIYTVDSNGVPFDVDESMVSGGTDSAGLLELDVTDISGSVLYSESYWPVTYPDTRRIKKAGTGTYYIDYGTEEDETNRSGTMLFNWTARETTTSPCCYRTQVFEIVPLWVLSILPRFRLMLDKSFKRINPEQMCQLGWSDAQLVMLLRSGLERISEAQPYPTFLTFESFPFQHGTELLMSAGLASALESQYLYAIDSDLIYNDAGHSFTQGHAAPLKSMYDSLMGTLGPRIREFKLHYVSAGNVGLQFSFNQAYYAMLSSASPGALFRNSYSNLP